MLASIESLSREELVSLVDSLQRQIDQLKGHKSDLEITLETVVEHSTELERQVYQQNHELQAAEQYVRQLNTQLEARVQQRTAELEVANRDLARASAERKRAQEQALALAQQLIEQQSRTIEQTYEAVHNGPLQDLAVLLRANLEDFSPEEMRSQLRQLNRRLRGIYQTMRSAISGQDMALYLEEGLVLDLMRPLPELLLYTFEHTMERDFPGFASLRFQITPDFSALADAALDSGKKRGICLFLQEALCNVGKHAIGASKLGIACERQSGYYCLSVSDNGQGVADASEPSTDRQGTRQARALAQQLGGLFYRRSCLPQGTLCGLVWPISPNTSGKMSYGDVTS